MKRGRHFRKESIITYLFMFAVVAASIGVLHFVNINFTGFAVYEQGDQAGFDEGIYSNTEYNGSGVVLSSGQTSGTYTSKVFDATADATWNSFTKTQTTPSINSLFAVDGQADIWKSADSGVTWSLIKDDYNNGDGNGATYMVKDSSDTLFILYGQDLWASNDVGITWTKINDDFNPSDSNNGLVIEIISNDNIFIVDGSKEVFKSTDSGVSFTSIADNFGGDANAKGMTSNSLNELFIVEGTAKVFKSTDSGVTWTLINEDYNGAIGNDATDMISDSSDNLFILHNQDLWVSINSGVDWTLVNDDFNGGSDSNSGIVSYIDSNDNIYIVDGSEDLYKSTDSGVSFSLVASNINDANGNVFGLSSLSESTSLSYQVKNCSQSDCSDASYQTPANLNNINLQSQYFQYQVTFTSPDSSITPELSSVSLDYDLINSAPTIALVEPQDGLLYLSNESLNLNYSVSDSDDNLDACWYSLDAGVTNTTLVNCANTTFDIAEGSHTLIIYANDSNGEEASDSASFDVDATGVSVSLSEPTGIKTSRTGISLTYTLVGNNLACWYNVKTSIGGGVIENTTLANCSNSNFDVASDGDYVLSLYVNNSLGNSASDSSSFTVSTSGGTVVINSGGGGGGGSSVSIETTELTISEIQDLIADAGDVKKINLAVKNTGTAFANDCKLKGEGEFSSWVLSGETKNLAAGEEDDFLFDLTIPEEIDSGKYNLKIVLECQEISKSVDFVVEIIEKQLLFNLLDAKRESEDQLKVVYSLTEILGIDQKVDLQFLLSDSNEQKAEVKETKIILASSTEEFELLIPIDSSLEGELSLLVNLNSETYSTFVQENIILGAPVSGFAIFGGAENTNRVINLVLILLFLVFAFFIIKRIIKHKKKTKKSKK